MLVLTVSLGGGGLMMCVSTPSDPTDRNMSE